MAERTEKGLLTFRGGCDWVGTASLEFLAFLRECCSGEANELLEKLKFALIPSVIFINMTSTPLISCTIAVLNRPRSHKVAKRGISSDVGYILCNRIVREYIIDWY